MAKYGSIGVDKIQETFFVRTHLDQDHVNQLAELYKAGAKLPAIMITRETNTLVDGRHRLHALRLLEKLSADVEWVEETDAGRLIGDALMANVGGSMPPTTSDIIYSIKQMIEMDVPNSVIIKRLTEKWPHRAAKNWVDNAHSDLSKDRMIRAKRAVTDEGKTVNEAAEVHGVKIDALRLALGGKKRRKSTAAEFKGALETIFRSRGQKMAAVFKKAQAAYEDGQLSKAALEDIIAQAEATCRKTSVSVRDWRKRLGLVEKSKKAEVA